MVLPVIQGLTVTELETLIRLETNTVGDTFWSYNELHNLMWQAHLILAREALLIQRTYSTTSVAGQQDYDFPQNTIAIKRITYNGEKLEPITMREDDALTLSDSSTAATGAPKYYFVWDETIYLRPVPDTSDLPIKIFSYNEPQTISLTSVFEIPSQFVIDTKYFVMSSMAAKEGDFNKSKYYMGLWDKAVDNAKKWSKKRLRGDSFSAVQDWETLPLSVVGIR
jgi:hypothetical protein